MILCWEFGHHRKGPGFSTLPTGDECVRAAEGKALTLRPHASAEPWLGALGPVLAGDGNVLTDVHLMLLLIKMPFVL